jgi:hypothetical protein
MRNGRLSKRQRECLEGRRQHMTAKEIGRQLNISHNTVAMHWRLARLKLRDERGSPAERHRGEHSDDPGAPIPSGQGLGGIDWQSRIAAAALIAGVLPALIFIAALISLIAINQLSLRLDQPYYGLFGHHCPAADCGKSELNRLNN